MVVCCFGLVWLCFGLAWLCFVLVCVPEADTAHWPSLKCLTGHASAWKPRGSWGGAGGAWRAVTAAALPAVTAGGARSCAPRICQIAARVHVCLCTAVPP